MLSVGIDQSVKRWGVVVASAAALCASVALFVSAFPVTAAESRGALTAHYSLGYFPISRSFSDFGGVEPLQRDHAHRPSKIGLDGSIG